MRFSEVCPCAPCAPCVPCVSRFPEVCSLVLQRGAFHGRVRSPHSFATPPLFAKKEDARSWQMDLRYNRHDVQINSLAGALVDAGVEPHRLLPPSKAARPSRAGLPTTPESFVADVAALVLSEKKRFKEAQVEAVLQARDVVFAKRRSEQAKAASAAAAAAHADLRAHVWQMTAPLPPALPPLPQSVSTPAFHTSSGQLVGPRHFGLTSAPRSEHMSLRDIELRLSAALSSRASAEPSRRRAIASLQALRDSARVPSPFSTILTHLTAELTPAILSLPAAAGDEDSAIAQAVVGIEAPEGSAAALAASSSMPCFFETVRELRSDRETWEQQMKALEARHAQQIGNRFVLDDKLEALQKALKESEARAEKLKLREEERLRLGGVTAQNYQVLLEEKNLLEKKVQKLEDAVTFRAEKLKDTQVELFIEKKRSLEQGLLYKEMREKKREGDLEAAAQLRHWQRALLRAHEGYLRSAEGMRSKLHDLQGLHLEGQLDQCLYWANGLEPVGVEQFMVRDEETSRPSSPTSQSAPNKAAKKLRVAGSMLAASAADNATPEGKNQKTVLKMFGKK